MLSKIIISILFLTASFESYVAELDLTTESAVESTITQIKLAIVTTNHPTTIVEEVITTTKATVANTEHDQAFEAHKGAHKTTELLSFLDKKRVDIQEAKFARGKKLRVNKIYGNMNRSLTTKKKIKRKTTHHPRRNTNKAKDVMSHKGNKPDKKSKDSKRTKSSKSPKHETGKNATQKLRIKRNLKNLDSLKFRGNEDSNFRKLSMLDFNEGYNYHNNTNVGDILSESQNKTFSAFQPNKVDKFSGNLKTRKGQSITGDINTKKILTFYMIHDMLISNITSTLIFLLIVMVIAITVILPCIALNRPSLKHPIGKEHLLKL